MKKATVREVQHNLSTVLRWVEDGEEVHITRRGRIVAKIVPARTERLVREWPDFAARARKIWRKPPRGKPVSRIIVADREDRV